MNARAVLDKPMPVRLTVDDFMLLERSGAFSGYAKTELIEGTIVAMNAQLMPHFHAKSEVAFRLRDACRGGNLDLQVYVEGSVRMSENDLPIPDVFVCRPIQVVSAPLPGEAIVLAVEIAGTTLNYDLKTKAGVYARAGIPEYWVVDLKGRKVHRLTEPDRTYRRTDIIAFEQPVSAATIPGLAIDTARLV